METPSPEPVGQPKPATTEDQGGHTDDGPYGQEILVVEYVAEPEGNTEGSISTVDKATSSTLLSHHANETDDSTCQHSPVTLCAAPQGELATEKPAAPSILSSPEQPPRIEEQPTSAIPVQPPVESEQEHSPSNKATVDTMGNPAPHRRSTRTTAGQHSNPHHLPEGAVMAKSQHAEAQIFTPPPSFGDFRQALQGIGKLLTDQLKAAWLAASNKTN